MKFAALCLAVLTGACAAAHRTAVVAHRGGAALAPENSLAAVELALELEVELIELDLRASSDGVVVVFHDETLERTSDGAGALAAQTAAQLAQLDVGAWKDARFSGERVPTLAQALAACRGRSELMLDVKTTGLARAARAELERSGFDAARLWVGTWNEEQRGEWMRELPHVRHAFIGEAPENATSEELARWLDLVVERGYRAVSLRWSKLPPACTELARARGLAVFVWTLNASAELEAALELGVDGVITDRPERALALRRPR